MASVIISLIYSFVPLIIGIIFIWLGWLCLTGKMEELFPKFYFTLDDPIPMFFCGTILFIVGFIWNFLSVIALFA